MSDSSDLRILGAWLAEWSARQNLQESFTLVDVEAGSTAQDSLSGENSRTKLRETIRPYPSEPASVGEVRLLSASLTPKVERPVYVVVLQEAGDWRLIVPFGPFSVPGTPDELLLENLNKGTEATFSGGLAVLEIREAVWVTIEQMHRSWSAGHMTPEALKDAEAVLQAHFNSAALSAELKERVGVKVSRRKSDPRHAYILEEANLLAGLGGLQPVWIEESAAVKETRALAFAADDSRAETEIKVFQVPEMAVELVMLRGHRSSAVVISVLGADGELSEALEGCKIYGIHGRELAKICDSTAKVSVQDLAGAFGLRTPEGHSLQVIRKV
jgi:hypothetical protein